MMTQFIEDNPRLRHRKLRLEISGQPLELLFELHWKGRTRLERFLDFRIETFPIERLTWRFRWDTKSESPPGTGTFHATANSGDSGRIIAETENVKGVDHDVQYVAELPRRYYFVVTSQNLDWTLTAEEPILP